MRGRGVGVGRKGERGRGVGVGRKGERGEGESGENVKDTCTAWVTDTHR